MCVCVRKFTGLPSKTLRRKQDPDCPHLLVTGGRGASRGLAKDCEQLERAAELHARNQKQAEAHVQRLMSEAQKSQADLKAKLEDLNKAGQTSWGAMSQALDESRNAFSKAIEATAKSFDEATKG
jgi:hypothetical protein